MSIQEATVTIVLFPLVKLDNADQMARMNVLDLNSGNTAFLLGKSIFTRRVKFESVIWVGFSLNLFQRERKDRVKSTSNSILMHVLSSPKMIFGLILGVSL